MKEKKIQETNVPDRFTAKGGEESPREKRSVHKVWKESMGHHLERLRRRLGAPTGLKRSTGLIDRVTRRNAKIVRYP